MINAFRALALVVAGIGISRGALGGEQGREIRVEGRYLYLPVVGGERVRMVRVKEGDREVVSLPVEAADGEAEWWAGVDVAGLKGKVVRVEAEGLPAGSKFLEGIGQGEERVKGKEGLYREARRPLVHFTASRGWINDPNGPIFYGGEYHLFFQWDPAGVRGNTKWWGHAVSRDLVRWEEREAAIVADEMGQIWSGSAVWDRENTSGLGTKERPPLVLFYTAAGRVFTQCMAYSTDGGKTFVKYEKNPVVPNIHSDNRDPRVVWHAESKRWVMVLWVKNPTNDGRGQDTIHFLTSQNLREWTPASQIDGYFECPDLIRFQGDRWVLTGANGTYQVGTFDGRVFRPVTPIVPSAVGGAFYAAQTFTDAPDGRVLQIGWLRGDVPDSPFNQQLSVVQDLELVETAEGVRLARRPVKELAGLGKTAGDFSGKTFERGEHFLGDLDSEAAEVGVEFAPPKGSRVELRVRGVPIAYEADKQELTVAGTRAAAPLRDGKQRIRVVVDRTAVEVFASDGLTYVPLVMFPGKGRRSVVVETNVPVRFEGLEVRTLGSMWGEQ